ncbi:hypothetical protein AAMO2058_000364700 [Amorphochlora amoebiformis]
MIVPGELTPTVCCAGSRRRGTQLGLPCQLVKFTHFASQALKSLGVQNQPHLTNWILGASIGGKHGMEYKQSIRPGMKNDDWWCPQVATRAYTLLQASVGSDAARLVLSYDSPFDSSTIRNLQLLLAATSCLQAEVKGRSWITSLAYRRRLFPQTGESSLRASGDLNRRTLIALRRLLGVVEITPVKADEKDLVAPFIYSPDVLDAATIAALKEVINRRSLYLEALSVSARSPTGDEAVIHSLPLAETGGEWRFRVGPRCRARLRMWINHQTTCAALRLVEDSYLARFAADKLHLPDTYASGVPRVGSRVAGMYFSDLDEKKLAYIGEIMSTDSVKQSCRVRFEDGDEAPQVPWSLIAICQPDNFPRLTLDPRHNARHRARSLPAGSLTDFVKRGRHSLLSALNTVPTVRMY